MNISVEDMKLDLERDGFTRSLLHHLTGVLQDTVGMDESEGFVSIVGQSIGEEINQQYKKALMVNKLPKDQLAKVLVDLKRRIQGDFYVIEETEEKIVLGNKRCPFGKKVLGRPSLCQMTTNVFGVIASDSNGYAKVKINNAIANGDQECKVTIFLKPNGEAKESSGREFIGKL